MKHACGAALRVLLNEDSQSVEELVAGVEDRPGQASGSVTLDLVISRAVPFGEDGAPIAPCGGAADSGGPERRTSVLVKWDGIETLEFTAADGGRQEAAL